MQEERAQRLKDIDINRQERQSKRRLQRAQQTQNFYKSLHMLQANNFLRENDSSTPFEDYSLFMYRQSAPEFNDRVKELERKLLYPVSTIVLCAFVKMIVVCFTLCLTENNIRKMMTMFGLIIIMLGIECRLNLMN